MPCSLLVSYVERNCRSDADNQIVAEEGIRPSPATHSHRDALQKLYELNYQLVCSHLEQLHQDEEKELVHDDPLR